MQSSLGIFIEKNMIKYAKLQKNKDDVQIESYNTVFYEEDKLNETIQRIISETNSYKVPISTNISDEKYNMFEVTSLLGIKDAKKAVAIEYEEFCDENGLNKALYEHKSTFVEDNSDPEKQRVLDVMAEKADLNRKNALFSGHKTTLAPISVSVENLVEIKDRENVIIVNIEEQTYVTTLLSGQLYQFDIIEQGMGEILSYINNIENSYSKSYEVCKNMTVYAQSMQGMYSEETSEYMDTVRAKLYEIAEKVKTISGELFSTVNKVYITGSGTCINNIDLFFQEFIPASKCEILKPYFFNNGITQDPIKEYIEVNSAIALALDGLGMLNKELNFSKGFSFNFAKPEMSGLSGANQDIDFAMVKEKLMQAGQKIVSDFNAPMESTEKLLLRGAGACLITICTFIIFSNIISKQIQNKIAEVDSSISETNIQLSKLNSDISAISTRTGTYESLITEMTTVPEEEPASDEESENTVRERIITKDSIPNLLNRIMFVIPKKVKLISIKNTTSDHIVIKAEAEKYEQLGYFKAVLTTNNILENVKSTSGEKTGSTVEVIIEGDLP